MLLFGVVKTAAKDFLPKAEFDLVYSKAVRLCVEIIVKTPDGVVLTKRDIEPCKGMWHYPGGTVLYGEHVEDAVHRLAAEELGVKVKIDKFIRYRDYPGIVAASGGEGGWPICLMFDVSIVGGSLNNDFQADQVACFKSVPENTIPEHAEFLNDYVFKNR